MSIEDNPYPEGTLLHLAWLEGHVHGYKESHQDHMEAMKKAMPTTAQDVKEFYETEFKKIIELEEAKRNKKIM